MTSERPVTMSFRFELHGGHVHADVFVGRNPGARGRAGTLIVREDEWPTLRAGLLAGGIEELLT